MTDHFESEVQKFVGQQNGDDLTPQIVYGMLRAVDQDAVARHQETVAVLEAHCSEAVVRDLAIRELQDWRRESSEKCVERMTVIAERVAAAAHAPVHAAHMASHHAPPRRDDDPPDAAFVDKRQGTFLNEDERSFRQLIMAWSATKKVFYIILTAVIGLVVAAVFAYSTAYFAADRAEKAGIAVEKTALPQPVITVTVTPSAVPSP